MTYLHQKDEIQIDHPVFFERHLEFIIGPPPPSERNLAESRLARQVSPGRQESFMNCPSRFLPTSVPSLLMDLLRFTLHGGPVHTFFRYSPQIRNQCHADRKGWRCGPGA